MARKPRDYEAELQDLMQRTKKVKSVKIDQLGEIAQLVGADALPLENFAGALMVAPEQSKKQPEAIARWTERGATLFQTGRKQGKTPTPGDAAAGGSGNSSPA